MGLSPLRGADSPERGNLSRVSAPPSIRCSQRRAIRSGRGLPPQHRWRHSPSWEPRTFSI